VSCSQAGPTRALAQAALGQQLLQARELRGRHGWVAGRAGAGAAGRLLGHQLRGAADLPQAQDDFQHARVVLRAAGPVARRVSAPCVLGRSGGVHARQPGKGYQETPSKHSAGLPLGVKCRRAWDAAALACQFMPPLDRWRDR